MFLNIDFSQKLQIDRQSTPLLSLKILEKSVSQKSRKLSVNILVGQILKSIIWRLACHKATIFSDLYTARDPLSTNRNTFWHYGTPWEWRPPENWNFVIFLYFENRFLGNRWGCFLDFICADRGLWVHSDCKKISEIDYWEVWVFFSQISSKISISQKKIHNFCRFVSSALFPYPNPPLPSPPPNGASGLPPNDSDHAKCGGVLFRLRLLYFWRYKLFPRGKREKNKARITRQLEVQKFWDFQTW